MAVKGRRVEGELSLFTFSDRFVGPERKRIELGKLCMPAARTDKEHQEMEIANLVGVA